MAKSSLSSGSNQSGFVRRALAATSLITAVGSANAGEKNSAPEIPANGSAQIVQTVKDKTGDLQIEGISKAELDQINRSGRVFSATPSKPARLELKAAKNLSAEAADAFKMAQTGTVDSGMAKNLAVPQISIGSDGSAKLGYDPNSGSMSGSIEERDSWKADFGLLKNIGSIDDSRLKASFQVLYSAAQLGTYVGVEKGSEFEKFAIAENFKIEGGKVQVTAALLKRVVEMRFDEVGTTERTKVSQKSVGVDYVQKFNSESVLQEIKTTLAYFDTDGKNLGTIGHIVTDTATTFEQTRVDGGVGGGKKFLAEIAATLRITETLKGEFSVGAENTRFDSMFDTASKSVTRPSFGVGFTYQPTDSDRLTAKARNSSGSTNAEFKFEHDFGNSVQAFVGGNRTSVGNGIKPNAGVFAGINITTDAIKGNKSKFSPLYSNYKDAEGLSVNELAANPLVATDTLQSVRKVTYTEREILVDKTALPAGSFLEYAKDRNGVNVLSALDLDTGAVNLVSVNSSNAPAGYAGYLSVTSNRYLRIASLEKFAAIAPFTLNVSIADNVGTFTLVSVLIQKGSAKLTTAVSRLSGVSAVDAAAFVAGTKTIAQISSGGGNTAPTESNVVAQTLNEDGSVVANVTIADTETAAASLTFSASSSNTTLFPGGSIVLGGSGANRTITLTPAANTSGTATITYVTTDGGGLSVTKTFNVTVNAVQDAPVFLATQGNVSFTSGSAISATTLSAATDADGDALTYSMTGLPAGLSFNPATRVLSGTPTVTGTFNVTYSVTDGTTTVSQSFQIVLTAAEVPPVMGDVPNQTPATGTAFSLNLSTYVTLTNGDAVTGYSLASGSLPPGLGLNTTTGVISGTPTVAGTYNVTVLATDNDGNSNTDAITFNVSDGVAPTAPVLTGGYATTTAANSVPVEVNGEIGAAVWVNGVDTGSVVAGTAKVTINLDTSGADGAKNFAIVLKDAAGNASTATNVSITADRTAPSVVSMPVSGIGFTSATATFTVGESGTGYYLVQTGGAAPSVATVSTTGTSIALTANSAQAVALSSLTAGTAYTVYFVAKDALGNLPAAVSSGTFNTLNNTAPGIVGNIWGPENTWNVVQNGLYGWNTFDIRDTEGGNVTVAISTNHGGKITFTDSAGNILAATWNGTSSISATVSTTAGIAKTIYYDYRAPADLNAQLAGGTLSETISANVTDSGGLSSGATTVGTGTYQ